MRRMLVASRGTFSLSVAVCNSRPLRDFVIGKLTSSDPGIALLAVLPATVDVFGCAAKCVRPDTSALFILGIEDLVSSASPDSPVLASLNSSRDLWPKRFPMPVVLWMPEYAVALLSEHARDFWAWKSHQFEFVSELASLPAAVQDRFLGDSGWAENLTADQKQFRIAELRQRIAEAGDPPPPELAIHVFWWLNELSGLTYVTGNPRESVQHLENALSIAQRIGSRHAESVALGNLGSVALALGETRHAIEYYEHALIINREIGDRHGEGQDLGNLGSAYAALGETRRAIEYYEQALAIDREIGDRRSEGAALGNLGNAYVALGETRRAIEYYEQALVIDREIDDNRGEGTALGNLGVAYGNLGETSRAIEYFEQYLKIAGEIGDCRGESAALNNLGLAYAALGETCRAFEYCERALAIDREIGDRCGEGRCLWGMAWALERLGRTDEAIADAEAALAIYEAIEDPNAEMVRRVLQEWRKAKGGEGG